MISNRLPTLDFALGDTADMLRDSVMRFSDDEIAPRAADIDRQNEFPNDLWRKMGDLGILGITVERPVETETTALGAAYLAGLQVGLFESTDAIAQNWQSDSEYEANMEDHERNRLLADWHEAVIKVKTGL